MKVSAALLLVGILAVGVFGFVGMDSTMDHDGGCIASLVNMIACPLEGLSSAIYHMSAYSSFSQAILTSSILLTLVLAFALLSMARSHLALLSAPVRARRLPTRASRAPERKFIRWLSLFENSPSL